MQRPQPRNHYDRRETLRARAECRDCPKPRDHYDSEETIHTTTDVTIRA